jgi:cytochrome c-type biogenesis protein CcmF
VPQKDNASSKFINVKTHNVHVGDTIYTNNGIAVLKRIQSNVRKEDTALVNMEILVGAELMIKTLDKTYSATPIFGIQGNNTKSFDAIVDEAGLRFRFTGLDPSTQTLNIESAEKEKSGDFIIMKAIVFPWINLVWAGTIIMVIGFFMALSNRVSILRGKAERDHDSNEFVQSTAV